MTTKPHYIDRWTYTIYAVAEDRDSPPTHLFLSKLEAELHLLKMDDGDGEAVALEYRLTATGFLHFMTRSEKAFNPGGDNNGTIWYHCACRGETWSRRHYCTTCKMWAGDTYEDKDDDNDD